ncbi:autotransporter outer membrane beta-barrel domain-containing protein [Phascolarctobacterium sp.]
MKNREEVSKKIARTLLAMSFVYAGGMFANCEKADAADPVSEKAITVDGTIISEEFNIQSADFTGGKDVGLLVTVPIGSSSSVTSVTADFTGKIAVDATNTTANALVVDASRLDGAGTTSRSVTVNLKDDVVLKAAAGNYALFLTGPNSYKSATLKVNVDDNHTVQLLGNVGVKGGPNSTKNLLQLHLTNQDSYLAGDLKLVSYDNNQIDFKLAGDAVWYPAETDIYYLGTTGYNTLHLDLDGGIIDLYHSQPGVARASSSARTFTLSGINDTVSGTNGTTFRIGSDVMGVNNGGTGTADKIVLSGDASYSGGDKYFIQIVADPSISSSVPVMDVADKKIVVAQLNGNMNSGSGTAVTGSTYKDMDLDAGLTLADVTPTLGAGDTAREYIIEKIDLENIRSQNSSGEKGSALTLAGIGASTMLNVASAWRAENNDLLRRMGDLRTSSDDAGVWVRMYGGKNEVVQGQRSDLSYKAVQGGYDFQNNLKNGRLFTGFTVSHLDGDVSGSRTDGDINSTMFGVYSSYVGDKGHFADLIVKYGRINSDFTTIKGTDRYGADYGSNGFSITTEYGYRQNLKNNFYIEPQAELTYSRIGGSDYTMSLNDKDGAKVSNDAFNSLIGRIGFTAGRQQEQSNVYAKLSLAREFKGEVATSASYGDVTRSYAGGGSDTWLEYGIGFNAKMSKGTNLYGEIEKTTGSVIRTKWRANMGLRYSF